MAGKSTTGSRSGFLLILLAPLVGMLLGGCARQVPAPVVPGPAAAPTPPAPTPPAAATTPAGFTILQINDVYKLEGLKKGDLGGLARVRTLRAELEAAGRSVLLLHGGDFLFPSVMNKYQLGEPMIDVLNLLDGDPARRDSRMFVTFGNHEFDSTDPGIVLGRVAQSDFTWLASTLRYRSGGAGEPEPFAARVPNVAPYALVEVGGVRAGLVGLTLDDQSRPWLDYGFTPPSRDLALRAALDALRAAGAELTIAVTHQNFGQDCDLARAYPELALIVGGHEHVALLDRAGQTWISKADADAATVMRIDVDRAADGSFAFKHELLKLDRSVALDPDVDAATQRWRQVLARTIADRTGTQIGDVVATTVHGLDGQEPAIRGRETALGNFLADVLRDRQATDIAFINGGAVRINDDIPAGGAVTIYDLEGIFYFDNSIVQFEVTGAELLDLLRISAAGAHLGHGRFLQVAGIRYRYHPERLALSQPVLDAADVEILAHGETAYAPLVLDRRYRAASLNYLWENGYRDGYPLFSLGDRRNHGTSPPRLDDVTKRVSWRRQTEEAIAALPDRRITTDVEGRIVRVGPAPPAPRCPAG